MLIVECMGVAVCAAECGARAQARDGSTLPTGRTSPEHDVTRA